MPRRISRTNFLSRLQDKSIDTQSLRSDRQLPSRVRDSAAGADLNRDGKIQGDNEARELFRRLDRFDRDGSYHSMHESENVARVLSHAQSPQRAERIGREDFVGALNNKRIRLTDLRLQPDITSRVASAAEGADLNRDGEIRGRGEAEELFGILDEFDSDGSRHSMHLRPNAEGVLRAATDATGAPPPRPAPQTEGIRGDFRMQSNSTAMRRARQSGLGRLAATKVPEHAAAYKRASALTGVPAEMIAAIHANESQFGTYRASTHGPESGFGLDPRFVSTTWGNSKLREHGLGSWQRGQDTQRSVLQSAVIAAEHLKRNAGYAGIEIQPRMNQGQLAGAATSYIQGINAAKRAARRGSSWMLNPGDNNPHPLHPGGTSIGRGGRVIRVSPQRKEGLLRWDTLLPLIQSHMPR